MDSTQLLPVSAVVFAETLNKASRLGGLVPQRQAPPQPKPQITPVPPYRNRNRKLAKPRAAVIATRDSAPARDSAPITALKAAHQMTPWRMQVMLSQQIVDATADFEHTQQSIEILTVAIAVLSSELDMLFAEKPASEESIRAGLAKLDDNYKAHDYYCRRAMYLKKLLSVKTKRYQEYCRSSPLVAARCRSSF